MPPFLEGRGLGCRWPGALLHDLSHGPQGVQGALWEGVVQCKVTKRLASWWRVGSRRDEREVRYLGERGGGIPCLRGVSPMEARATVIAAAHSTTAFSPPRPPVLLMLPTLLLLPSKYYNYYHHYNYHIYKRQCHYLQLYDCSHLDYFIVRVSQQYCFYNFAINATVTNTDFITNVTTTVNYDSCGWRKRNPVCSKSSQS